jgi:serine/threonine protein kinase
MNVQEIKKSIRDFLKVEKTIISDLGSILVKKRIGEGGNALVYSAEFGKSEVALKMLAEQRDSSKYNRFLTEFREIIQLAETKAVVPVYYFGHLEIGENQFPYMVMKKYPYTLKTWCATKPIQNFKTFKGVFLNLLDIISVIHEKNIVHRDLKPENILVTESGEMVLADFGISWFDPELYDRNVHTEKGDRMANFDFSAPEQFLKGTQPHPTMDIFALGQIITWMITGGVARGERKPLTAVDKVFALIEPAISKMLSRSPEDRPHSIQEVRDILNRTESEFDENRKQNKKINLVIGNLKKYDDILRECFPGKRGLVETNEVKKNDRLLNKLSEAAQSLELWWTQGTANMPIKTFNRLNEDTLLMDYIEIEVEKIWVYKDFYSLDHNFILLKTKAMQSFDIYDGEATFREEAAWFNDRYISREEYDDGVTEIDGETIWLEGRAELRVRNLQPQYYFITTPYHPIGLMKNDFLVSSVYKKLIQSDVLEEEDIELLTKLKKHEISIMMS